MVTARFFETPAEFRAWLEEHHDAADELVVGYWKKATGKPSVTWEETVDEALCYGWIDGIRRHIDDESFSIRFTPRRKDSIWSQRNLNRVKVLRADGRMQPPGIAVWQERKLEKSGYSFEGRAQEWSAAEAAAFGDHLAHFMAQPPGYRRQWVAWVYAAKREDTRARRLAALVDASRQGIRVDPQRPFEHVRDR